MLTDIAGDDADPMAPDLSRLSTDELALFEKLLLKIAGEFTGDVVPPFRVEFVDRIESNAGVELSSMHRKG
jgi:hypothetical protein